MDERKNGIETKDENEGKKMYQRESKDGEMKRTENKG